MPSFRVTVFTVSSIFALAVGVGDALAQSIIVDRDETRTTSIVATETSSIVINNGTITTTDDNAHGILAVGDDAEINIDSSALAFRTGDTVVTLDPTGLSATRMALGATMGQIRR